MKTITIHKDQFYDIYAPEYKLDLDLDDKEQLVTFTIVKFLKTNGEDKRIEEITLDKEQLIELVSKLNTFLKK